MNCKNIELNEILNFDYSKNKKYGDKVHVSSVAKRLEVIGAGLAIKGYNSADMGNKDLVSNVQENQKGLVRGLRKIRNLFKKDTPFLKKKVLDGSRSQAVAKGLFSIFIYFGLGSLFMKRVLPGIYRTSSSHNTFGLSNAGGNGPSGFRSFVSMVSHKIANRSKNGDFNQVFFTKKEISLKLISDETFLDAGDYLIFASKDFALDPQNKSNHLHILVKYSKNSYKEYTVKSNKQVRNEVSPAIQLIHNEPLFLSKTVGETYIFENPEFIGFDEAINKITNSSSESLLGKGLDDSLDSEEGRSFLENLLGDSNGSVEKTSAVLDINYLAYRAIHHKLVSDFRQKSDYVLFMDTQTNQKFYKHKGSFEAKYPRAHWKRALAEPDLDPVDLKKIKNG